jgi:hypothetical protein
VFIIEEEWVASSGIIFISSFMKIHFSASEISYMNWYSQTEDSVQRKYSYKKKMIFDASSEPADQAILDLWDSFFLWVQQNRCLPLLRQHDGKPIFQNEVIF